MEYRFLQANINHAREAQDLLLHTMSERKCTLGIVSEPWRIPQEHPNWASDSTGTIAITWQWWNGAPSCSVFEQGTRFVAVRWGNLMVIGAYLPPSGNIEQYETWLEDIGNCIRRIGHLPIILGGDFNAWHHTWGSRKSNVRGDTLSDWASAMNLTLLNQGSTSTCVRPQGSSIVDLTWATPTIASRLAKWSVLSEVEHLSDHRYIEVELQREKVTQARNIRPRWAIKKLNEDNLMAAVMAATWSNPYAAEDPRQEATWLQRTIVSACNGAMPRVKCLPRKSAYWWTEEIAELRRTTNRWSRRVQRKKGTEEERKEASYQYREARRLFRLGIKKAKAKAWDEFIQTLQEDPWGRPYRVILNKTRPWSPPLTELLEPEFVKQITDTLFPSDRISTHIRTQEQEDSPDWTPELELNNEEFSRALKRSFGGKATAPGPDGVQKKILALVMKELWSHFESLLNNCLRKGVFPDDWKVAELVLIPKVGKDKTLPSSYRPICLLDEMGKLCERIIAGRITEHLSQKGPNLEVTQFGFRQGRSTLDAVNHVRKLTEEQTSQGRVVLAISIDIKNAFNSLPWDKIREALKTHGVPEYLCRTIDDYLNNRWIVYRDKTGNICRKQTSRGVPQGSILGPLLWNIGFDIIIRSALPPFCHIVSYADDTLVLAGGEAWREAISRGEVAVQSILRSIHSIGLKVAVAKTEALLFHDKAYGKPPPNLTFTINEVPIRVNTRIKYLGLVLDGQWSFENHFQQVAEKAERRAQALCRLLPRLGGPGQKVRRLYAYTINAIALYGAPVWSGALQKSKRGQAAMNKASRPVALRLARAYRTVAQAAIMVLAGLPPLRHVAMGYEKMYKAIKIMQQKGVQMTNNLQARLRADCRKRITQNWKEELMNQYGQGSRVIDAILPVLEEWTQRTHGGLTYRMTQLITGHGCFGKYLKRIGKEETSNCHHCEEGEDTAQHTLEVCSAWNNERAELTATVGEDLTLPAIVRSILQTEEAWKGFIKFSEIVMTKKEIAEREREGIPASQCNSRLQR